MDKGIPTFFIVKLVLFQWIFIYLSSAKTPRRTSIDELLYTTELNVHNELIKRTSGDNWVMWDRNSRYPSPGQNCSWSEYYLNDRSTQMCTHGEDEIVSKVIKLRGRWGECDLLTLLWHDYTRRSVFIDAGANIGSCVLHMLFTTSASILAFEPHPRNLFCLTSTLMQMDLKYRKRVFLFPVALGSESKMDTMTGMENNFGHSLIYHQPLSDEYHPVINIPVERLDSIVSIEANVELVKMDVEGYECNAVEGMGILIHKTHIIYSEVNDHYLQRNKCSKLSYHSMLESSDFLIYNKTADLFPSMVHFRDREFLSEYNIVAKKNEPYRIG